MEYKTIQKASEEFVFKERNSKFLSQSFPVRSEEEIKSTIDEIRRRHPKASHVCYAWRLGWNPPKFGNSDDGEPPYTAGTPIQGQLERCGLTDALVTVVRYYGGVKLGKGGLIKAYRSSAEQALSGSRFIGIEPTFRLQCRLDFQELTVLRRFAPNTSLDIHPDFSSVPMTTVLVAPLKFRDRIERWLREHTIPFQEHL